MGFVTHKDEYLTIPSFTATGLVRHAFTTRHADVGDVSRSIGINPKNLVMTDQVHGDKTEIVDGSHYGKTIIAADGLITSTPNTPLRTVYADCVPLFFLDPVRKVIASSHSGWRSTILEIGRKTPEKMGGNPADILVGIGPSIGPCHFEVGNDVLRQFTNAYGFDVGIDNHVDIWEVNRRILHKAGVLDENITIAKRCTCCEPDMFYSYRLEKESAGRMCAIIELV